MSELSDDQGRERKTLRDQIIGLGAKSVRKTYYPQLRRQIEELKKAKTELEEKSASLLRTLSDLEEARRRAEESELQFRTFYEEITDGILVGSLATYRLRMVNPAFCRMMGYLQPELLKLSAHEIHPRDEFPRVAEMMAKLKRGENVVVRDLRYIRKDGSVFYADIHATTLMMRETRYFIAACTDVTERKLAEQALSREQVFTNAILDGIPGLAYLYDDRGMLVRWNKQNEMMSGYTAEELSQMHVLHWFRYDPAEMDRIAGLVKTCLRDGYAEADAYVQIKSGEKILFHLTAVRLQISGKNYFAGIGIDITEQKRAENELRRLNRLYAMLSEVNQAVVRSTSHQEMLDFICKAASEFGIFSLIWVGKVDWKTHRVEPVAAAGKSLGFLDAVKVYADDRPEGRGTVGLSIREGRTRVTNDFLDFAGSAPWADPARTFSINACTSLPIWNQGKIYGALVVYSNERDVFQDKEVKLLEEVAADISFALDHLDQEERRKRDELALKKAKEDAEAANRAKDQFIAVLSHELRTPLTPVLTAASLLQSMESIPDEIRPELDIIRRNVELEARLIDDLLDVTRISRSLVQLHREEVDVHAALLKTLEICRAEIAQKAMEIVLELDAREHYVLADSARLQQVFWNLLKNALKFTPVEGRISIHTENVDGRIRIEVADTGIGIAPEALSRIFNAFEQGEKTSTRRFGGLGLGLSIAKAIVVLHHGTISAQSNGPGQGAIFSVELQTVAPEPGVPAVGAAPLEHTRRRWRILLVEDNFDTLRILSRLMERWGYEVRGADSVAGALKAAEGEPFDLLISDIGLPDGSGLEVMRHLKKNQPGVRGLAISGFGTDEDIRQSREAGFTEHLTKPVGIEGLRAAIDRLVSAG